MDVDDRGLFDSPIELLSEMENREEGAHGYLIRCNDHYAGFPITAEVQRKGRRTSEFADLFVPPRYRGRGVATSVIERTTLRSSKEWLIAVFGNDLNAIVFWGRASKRLPFSSFLEIIPPEAPGLHEFVVNGHGA